MKLSSDGWARPALRCPSKPSALLSDFIWVGFPVDERLNHGQVINEEAWPRGGGGGEWPWKNGRNGMETLNGWKEWGRKEWTGTKRRRTGVKEWNGTDQQGPELTNITATISTWPLPRADDDKMPTRHQRDCLSGTGVGLFPFQMVRQTLCFPIVSHRPVEKARPSTIVAINMTSFETVDVIHRIEAVFEGWIPVLNRNMKCSARA